MLIMEYNEKKDVELVKEDNLEKVTGGIDDNEISEVQGERNVMQRDKNPNKKELIATDAHIDQGAHLH